MFQKQETVYSNVKTEFKRVHACDEAVLHYQKAWSSIVLAEEELSQAGMLTASIRATMLREILEKEVDDIDDYRSRLFGIPRVETIQPRKRSRNKQG